MGSTSQSPARLIDGYRYKERTREVKRKEELLYSTATAARRAEAATSLDLESSAEAELVGPRPRLRPEPAVPPGLGLRRRRRAAQHLPHHVHVLVLARAHLLPQPPQPCKTKQRPSQTKLAWTKGPHKGRRPRLPYRSGEPRIGPRRRARPAAPAARRGPTNNPWVAGGLQWPEYTHRRRPDFHRRVLARQRSHPPHLELLDRGPVASAPPICTHTGEGRARTGPPGTENADPWAPASVVRGPLASVGWVGSVVACGLLTGAAGTCPEAVGGVAHVGAAS